MILYLSYEELAALESSAEQVLVADATGGGIAAPPQLVAEVEQFTQRLTGDITVTSLDDQRSMQQILHHLLAGSHARMDEAVLLQHAAAESAVAAYFEYAHILGVQHRLSAIGEEMAAIVQLMTGADPDSENGRRFDFPE